MVRHDSSGTNDRSLPLDDDHRELPALQFRQSPRPAVLSEVRAAGAAASPLGPAASTSSVANQHPPPPAAAAAAPATGRGDRPPRPMNAWLLFRTAQVKRLAEENPGVRRSQGELSKIIAEMWRTADAETRREFEDLARLKKAEHQRQYPDYRYAPGPKAAKANKPRSQPSQIKSPPAREAKLPSQPEASTSQNSLPPPQHASSSGRSPRAIASPQLGYHPYHAQASPHAQAAQLPPIDTSSQFATHSRWNPPSASSAVGPYFSTPHSFSSVPSTEEPQQYGHHRLPASAPADFASFGERNLSSPQQGLGSHPFYEQQYHQSAWTSAQNSPPSSSFQTPVSASSSPFSPGPPSASSSNSTKPPYALPQPYPAFLAPTTYGSPQNPYGALTQPSAPAFDPSSYPPLRRADYDYGAQHQPDDRLAHESCEIVERSPSASSPYPQPTSTSAEHPPHPQEFHAPPPIARPETQHEHEQRPPDWYPSALSQSSSSHPPAPPPPRPPNETYDFRPYQFHPR
ncbi:hypothetical protein JCM10212_002265 [Sporobolomyces blumeae]